MRILIYGAGVIGSFYASRFAKAGLDVTVLARGQRLKELDKRFSTVNGKKLKKTERVEQTVLNSVLPVSKAEICDILPDVSPSTVEAVLGKMVKTGSVMKLGQARATKYVNAKYIK